MKKHLIFLLALFAIVLSCDDGYLQDDITTEPKVNALQTQKALSLLTDYDVTAHFPAYQVPLIRKKGALVTKPMKIRGSGTVEIKLPPYNKCKKKAMEILIKGQGHATHLGLFSFNSTYCTIDGKKPLEPIIGIQIAANGDELHSVLLRTGVDKEFGPYQDWVFFDGTGRFEDVKGKIRLYSTIDYIGGTYSNYGEGRIAY